MKKKIIILCSVVAILLFGFLYIQNSNLIADDKDGKKNCSSTCTKKTNTSSSESKAGCESEKVGGVTTDATTVPSDQYAVYEFVTDKIDCDDCKPGMSEKLMSIAGVKEINFGETCNYSKMTSVKVFYSPTDTTPEVVAASVKEKGLECGKDGKCTSKSKTEKKL